MLAIGSPWTERLFDGPFYLSPLPQRLPACHLVFVQSLDGNTGARNPQTLGGGETDKHLIYEGLARVSADAVLAGSSTVRGGSLVFSVWHPELVRLRQTLGQPRHPIQIVATRRGVPIDRELLYNIPELRVVLLTAPDGFAVMREALAERPWITPIVVDIGDTLIDAFEQLRAMGVRANLRCRRTGPCRRLNRCGSRAGPLSHDVAGRRRRARHADVLASARTADGCAEARHAA